MMLINQNPDVTVSKIFVGIDDLARNRRQSSTIFRIIYSLFKQAIKKTIQEADILITTTVLSAQL